MYFFYILLISYVSCVFSCFVLLTLFLTQTIPLSDAGGRLPPLPPLKLSFCRFFFFFFTARGLKKRLVKDKTQCSHCWSGSETSDLFSFCRFFLSSSQQDANRFIKALLALNGCQSRGRLSKDLANSVRLKVKPFYKSAEKFFFVFFY